MKFWLMAIALTALCFPELALADYTNTGVRISCLPQKRQLRFSAETLVNEPALWAGTASVERRRFAEDARKRGLYMESPFDVTCKFGDAEFTVSGWVDEPSEQGECGADPGGAISVSLNGRRFMDFISIGNECTGGLWSGSLVVKSSAVDVTLCGYGRLQKPLKKPEKCMSFRVPTNVPGSPAITIEDLGKIFTE